jgi:hypothetical protein
MEIPTPGAVPQSLFLRYEGLCSRAMIISTALRRLSSACVLLQCGARGCVVVDCRWLFCGTMSQSSVPSSGLLANIPPNGKPVALNVACCVRCRLWPLYRKRRHAKANPRSVTQRFPTEVTTVIITKSKPKSGRKCAVCGHPRRESLNQAIAMGKMSMSEVATKIGVNKSSVSRHFRRHLQPAIVAAGGGATLAWNVKRKSRQLVERMESLLEVITGVAEAATTSPKANCWKIGKRFVPWAWRCGSGCACMARRLAKLVRDGDNREAMQIQIICPQTQDGALPRIAMCSGDAVEDDEVEVIGLPRAV